MASCRKSPRHEFAIAVTLCALFLNLLAAGPAIAAVTAAALTADAANGVNANSFSTASITPAANNLVLAWVTNTKATTPDTPTLSGNGLTWVQVATVTWGTIGTPTARTTLFRAMGAAPSAGAVTIGFAGVTQTGAAWSIVQFGGVDVSGTNGSGAVVQSVTGRTDNASAAAGLSITLAALGNANNASAGGFSNMVNLATSISAGAGYTASAGATHNSPATSIRSEWKTTGSTTVDVTQSAVSHIGGIAVEVKADLCPGNVVTTTTDVAGTMGSLRECINKANVVPGTTISFNIAGCPGGICTITPGTALPAITANSTTIDGYTQTGAQANTVAAPGASNAALKIELSGNTAGGNGLTLQSQNNVIKGLVINGGWSIGIALDNSTNTVSGNYFGTNVAGTSSSATKLSTALYVPTGSNTIGGAGVGDRNLISGTASNAIWLLSTSAQSNQILNNYIGTNANGTSLVANPNAIVFTDGASSNTIQGNLISGNSTGIWIEKNTANVPNLNVIKGNKIGTDINGTSAIANGTGIYIFGGATRAC